MNERDDVDGNALAPNIPAVLNGRLRSPTAGFPRRWKATGSAS